MAELLEFRPGYQQTEKYIKMYQIVAHSSKPKQTSKNYSNQNDNSNIFF